MATKSTTKEAPHLKWEAEHRYGDVYECTNGARTLSHSVKGLNKAREALAEKDTPFAKNQLAVVEAKLAAIDKAAPKGTP